MKVVPFEKKLQRLKDDWVFAYELGAFVYVGKQDRYPSFYLLSKEQFNDHFADDFPGRGAEAPVRAMLTNGCRQVARLAYLPGNVDRLTNETVDGFTMPVVNQWSDCRIPKAFVQPGNIDRYLEHVHYVIPGDRPRHYIMDTFATWVRTPGIKTNVVPMLLGPSGLGKDLCIYPVGQALGESNYRVATPDDLLSPYTDWMNHIKLANIDLQEIDNPKQVMKKITPVAASPPTRLRIHGKWIRHYEIANLIQFVITRHTMDGLAIPEGDRRFYPYHSPATPRSHNYYAPLWDWVKNLKNLGAIIHYYRHAHKIDPAFNPLTPPPISATKRRLVEAGKSRLRQYLEAARDERRAPLRYPLFTIHEVQQHFNNHVSAFASVTPHELGNVIEQIGGKKLGQLRLSHGLRPYLWAIGPRVDEFQHMRHLDLREHYEEQHRKVKKSLIKSTKRAAIRVKQVKGGKS